MAASISSKIYFCAKANSTYLMCINNTSSIIHQTRTGIIWWVIRTPLCRPTRKPLESSALKLELPREDRRDLCPQNSRQRKSSEIQSFHIASSIFVCILLISLSRNQVQLVACKALLFQHAKDLSSLTLIFNLCSIFCSFTSKCMSNPNYNLFTTKTLQSHHGTHKSNSNSNSTSVLQPTSPPRCSIMSGTGGSSR